MTTSTTLPSQKRSIINWILEIFKNPTDDVFMIDGSNDQKLTFKQLSNDAMSLAISLRKKGFGPGKVIAIIGDISTRAVVAEFASWVAGATVCAINADEIIEDILQKIELLHAAVIFTDSANEVKVKNVINLVNYEVQLILLEEYDNLLETDTSNYELSITNPEDHLMNITFTSGTTGTSKGVKHTDDRILAMVLSGFWDDTNDSFYCFMTPFYWMTNMMVLLSAVVQRKKLLYPNSKDPKKVLNSILKYKPTAWFSNITRLMELTEIPNIKDYDLTFMKSCFVGGSKMVPEQKLFINEKLFKGIKSIWSIYGCSEVGGVTRWYSEDKAREFSPDDPRDVSVGRVLKNSLLKVVDLITGEELGPNQVGELVIKSPSVTNGYINKEYPENYKVGDWWHLQDIGSYDEEGFVHFLSRKKDIIKVKGYHVVPSTLENILLQYKGVSEVSVVGKPHLIDGERPTAFIVIAPGFELTENELIDYVKDRVNEYERLSGGIYFVKSLPKSAVGKILKRNLIEILIEQSK